MNTIPGKLGKVMDTSVLVDISEYHQMKERIKELETENAKNNSFEPALKHLFALCKKAEEALIWCGGSDDFAEGGKARVGWKNEIRPLISELHKVCDSLILIGLISPEQAEYLDSRAREQKHV